MVPEEAPTVGLGPQGQTEEGSPRGAPVVTGGEERKADRKGGAGGGAGQNT